MTRRAVSLLLPIALALFTAQFARAQRGGGHGAISAGHMGGGLGMGSFRAGGFARGSGAFSSSRPSQAYRPPSLPFEQARPYMNSPYSAYNRQPYPGSENRGYGNRGYGNRGYRNGVGYPYPYSPYGYGLYGGYFLPDVLDYPFDSLFDDDGNGYGYGQTDENASPPPPPQQGMYAPPEDYAPEPPYPQANEEPSDGYRPAYQDSGNAEPVATQPPTTLVFQDGRPTEQVRNYVLTRTTLYVLDGNSHSDIPLAALNLPATIEANRSVGIDFSLPANY